MAKKNEMSPDLWRGERHWNPFRELGRLQRRLDRVFDDILPSFTSPSGFMRPESHLMELEDRGFTPPIDLEESEGHYLVSMDLPGLSKEDIKIEIRDNQLVVCGERQRDRKLGEGSTLNLERYYGAFQRWFSIPQNVDPNKIEAQYDKGVLRIAIPKTEATQAKAIPIKEETPLFNKLLGKDTKEGKSEKAA